MSRKKKIFLAAGVLAIITVLFTAIAFAEDGGADEHSRFFATAWALLPPVIAIALALITKEVYSSLFIGMVVGGLMVSGFNPVKTLDAVVNEGFIDAISGTAGIFAFLVILGIFVALMNKAGGSAAFGQWAQKHVKTRVGAQLATFALGVLIFIDDYFNCLTVGSVMRPVTDTHKISRAKLSYLIDATAAPVCMIAPISSWAAAVATSVKDAPEITELYSPIELFVRAIPFNFYSLLTLVFVIGLAIMKFDFGSMRTHEVNAKNKNDLFTTGVSTNKGEEAVFNPKAKVIDLILPIIILIICCIFGLMYVGGFFDPTKEGIYHNFANSLSETDATVALPWGSIIALVIAVIYMICRRVITFKDAMECVPKGFIAMVPAILILTLATALKNMTGMLGAAEYVEGIMKGASKNLVSMLPAVIFIVACLLAFATGTSWGTFGILIPIVLVVFKAGDPLLFVGISACLAGAVCGDHCSPISDTTIMSSAGAQCDHINHVSTQIPYAVSVAVLSLIMFIFAGFVPNAWIALPVGIVLTVAFLFVMKAIMTKKHGKDNI